MNVVKNRREIYNNKFFDLSITMCTLMSFLKKVSTILTREDDSDSSCKMPMYRTPKIFKESGQIYCHKTNLCGSLSYVITVIELIIDVCGNEQYHTIISGGPKK